MTKVSTGISLVWQLAAREAIAGKFAVIEPEHFLMALLKVAEAPPEQVERLCPEGSEAGKDLVRETLEVQRAVQAMGVDSTAVRRKLRLAVGKGNVAYDGGEMHRSEKSRDVFNEAARLADEEGSDVLGPCHLLAAIARRPSSLVHAVLGDRAGAASPASELSRLIAESGADLTGAAAKGEVSALPGRMAEARAILKRLGEVARSRVLLVSDSSEAVGEVTATLACLAAKAHFEGRRLRIVDVARRLPSAAADGPGRGAVPVLGETVERIHRVIAEAAGCGNLVIRLPDVEALTDAGASCSALKALAESQAPAWLVRIGRKAYREHIEQDAYWRRVGAAIWVADKGAGDIPDAL